MYTFLGIIWVIFIILFTPRRSWWTNEEIAPSLFSQIYNPIKSRNTRRKSRERALLIAKNYLKPYSDIFGDLCLTNKNCSVKYSSGNMIFAMDKNTNSQGKKLTFSAKNFEVLTIDEVWDILCDEFSDGTTAEDVLIRCSGSTSSIQKVFIPAADSAQNSTANTSVNPTSNSTNVESSAELIDVNSCSDSDLAALPGINIVMAKKIIKIREGKGSFKSVDDFFSQIDLKDHFVSQIRNLITANKVQPKAQKCAKNERILDI